MESLSRPLQRNHSNFSRKLSNANGFSSKNAYADVFAGPPKSGAPTFSSRVEDYSEIFGSRASSIPVLDISDLDETNISADFRNSTPDYSSIFVGFRDEDIGMSYEGLFAGPKGPNNSSSAKTRTQSATKSPRQDSDRSNSLERNQSFDAGKQINMSYHKTSQKIKDETKVTTHVAELRAVPGFTCFIDETAPPQKTEGGKQKPPVINDVRQKMDFSATSPVAKKQTKGGVVRSRSGSSWDGTYSNDKLFKNAHENHLKSHPSNSEKNKGSLKRSTTAASNKEVPRTDARDRSPDSSDEELDVDSAAAASVAALRKALEKAQESIRIAKELMEKKDQPPIYSKKGSKSRSKVKDRRENSIAPRRNRTDEKNNTEMCENTRVVLNAKDLDAAEKCEGATGFFELVNNGKHRRAISAFEQANRNKFREMKTTGETLEQQEGITEKAEVVEATDLKEHMERKISDFKISQDREDDLDKFESTFVVHELEEIERPGAQEVEETEEKEDSVKVEELMEAIEDEEFFESQDFDEKDQEERVNGSLELVENEHKHEVREEEIVEERTKDVETEENDEQVLAKRLQEAFQWVENENRLREAFDSYSNEPKQIDENAREVVEIGGHEEREMAVETQKEEDIKSEEYERTQVDEKIPNDACDWKESEENVSAGEPEGNEKAVAGAYGYEADENIMRETCESEENEEIEIDKKRPTDANDGEESETNMKEKKEKRENDRSEENEEIEVDEIEKRPTDGNDGEESEKNMKEKRECDGSEENEEIEVPEEEEEEEEGLHSNRVSYVSNSSTSETSEEACQNEINDNNVNTSPKLSDAEGDEKDPSEVLRDDGNSENFGSTDSDVGENQVEQNTEDSELASDPENVIDILVSEFTENDEIVKEDVNIKPREIDEEIKTGQDTEKNEESVDKSIATEEEEEEEEEEEYKETVPKEELREIEEANKREREREKDRIVVERAIREARERAFAEARERAERATVERVNAEVRQRVMAEARDKPEKASSFSSSSSSAGGTHNKSLSSSHKASQDAKLKAERAAVERATSEARKRALEKSLSQKTTSEARPQPVAEMFQGASGDSSSSDSQRSDGTNSESYLRSKAKLEKHQRIMQRAAKALAEKNMRDLLAQKEQAERNRLSESLDADIKRWSKGKEGNLHALLSTLQYILGPGSGWQPVSLTDIVTTSAVKKAYRKATLYVHPDKLQQRGASIQQKYICEKVFDLLKAAWNKFNAEER